MRSSRPLRGMFGIRVHGELTIMGPNLAKTTILAKYNTVNQVDRLHGGTQPAHAALE